MTVIKRLIVTEKEVIMRPIIPRLFDREETNLESGRLLKDYAKKVRSVLLSGVEWIFCRQSVFIKY
jgi:hypothetical protein